MTQEPSSDDETPKAPIRSAFLIKIGNQIIGSYVATEADRPAIRAEAARRGAALYVGRVVERDGRLCAKGPYVFDWDTINNAGAPPVRATVPMTAAVAVASPPLLALACPYCDQQMTSTPGRTNHVKAKHPERYEEYRNRR